MGDFNSSQGDIAWLMKEAKNHTCFQVSMACKVLTGILDVDAAVTFRVDKEGNAVGGLLSLRNFLLKHPRPRDNMLSLLAEIHQRQMVLKLRW